MEQKNFMNRFLDKYKTESFEVQKKVFIIFWINVIMVPTVLFVYLLHVLNIIIFSPIVLILIFMEMGFNIVSVIMLFRKLYSVASLLTICSFQLAVFLFSLPAANNLSSPLMTLAAFLLCGLILANALHSKLLIHLIVIASTVLYHIILCAVVLNTAQADNDLLIQDLVFSSAMVFMGCIIYFITMNTNRSVINTIDNQNKDLTDIASKVKNGVVELVSISKEMHATAEEQTSASTEQASGITEVSATLEELTITAKQITVNAGELVVASGETTKLLEEGQSDLMQTVGRLDEVGVISKKNTTQVNELGKRSRLINEMVEIIKDIANKTNMLSINASIEASRAGEAGKGFSVVAAEIRELSKETITTAKKVETAAQEIQSFISDIIIASESESDKVLQSGEAAKDIYQKLINIVEKIGNNYSFTQKIDVSIKQQENGSRQASETMHQMSEIAKQSAEVARQTAEAVQNIVDLSKELDLAVQKFKTGDDEDQE
jgi:methyl-accepting chemotaxis protein